MNDGVGVVSESVQVSAATRGRRSVHSSLPIGFRPLPRDFRPSPANFRPKRALLSISEPQDKVEQEEVPSPTGLQPLVGILGGAAAVLALIAVAIVIVSKRSN